MLPQLGRAPLTYLVGGFVVSACAIGFIGLLAASLISLRPLPPAATNAVVHPPTPRSATASAISEQATTTTTTSPSSSNPILHQTEQLLADGEAQRALELLKEHLAEFTEPFEKAQAYEVMGRAEMELGYFQFAASHFNQANTLAPSPERLFHLALAYDLGGNLEEALKHYEALLTEPRLDEELRVTAEERAIHLREVLGTATPGGP